MNDKTTHFGFQQVAESEKAGKVRGDVNAQVVVLDADKEPAAPAATPATTPPAAVAAPAARTEALPAEPARPVAAARQDVRDASKPAAPKPEPAKPATPTPAPAPVAPAPAASSVGFAVQLGAFGKAAADLSAPEAALMAAMLPNPVRRDARRPGPGLRRLAGIYRARAARAAAATACLRP